MITIIDGGMGQELIARAGETATPLWSADAMLAHPDLVVDVHRSYIDAGATVITVNAYSATRCRLAPHGREDEYAALQRQAVALANQARDEARRDTHRGAASEVRIAGCLSPFAWSYRPELAPSVDELIPHYAETVALQRDGVDLMLCETMGSAREGAAAAVAAQAAGLEVWVSWTLHDDASGRLRSNETIAAAAAALDEYGVTPAALLVNCSLPESITAGLDELGAAADRWSIPFGAYANGFGEVDPDYLPGVSPSTLADRPDLDPTAHTEWVRRWLDRGATIIGGCCNVGPAHIAAAAELISSTRPTHGVR